MRTQDLSPRSAGNVIWRTWPIAALVIADLVFHKPVSDVCDWLSARWGFAAYELGALIGIPLACALVVVPVLVLRSRHAVTLPVIAALFVLAALTAAAQHWLMVVNIELIHLPQFALVTAAALWAGLKPGLAFLAGTAAGIVDETYQHFVVYAGVPGVYFDINDIVLNALGAAWAIVLFAGMFEWSRALRRAAAGQRRVPEPVRRWATVAVPVILLGLSWWLDPPVFDPLFSMTPASQKAYRVLSAPEGVILCGCLWLIAAAAIRTGPGRLAARFNPARSPVLFSVLPMVLFGGCAGASPRPDLPEPQTPYASLPFITTFWCGPPLDEFSDARAAQIAEAGFTTVGPPCEGPIDPVRNRRALDVAASHGLTMWIADARFDERATGRPDWESHIAAAVADYQDHPALGGYFVSDEPSADQFGDLARVVSRLPVDGTRLAYVNLLPDYFPRGLGTDSYREYVERFIGTVRPGLVSYDYYPFRLTEDRPTFFSSLSLVREVSGRRGLPFMLIVLAMPHGLYRDPTEAELSWQVFHALAYGARGISYFAYWTPVNVEYAEVMQFRHGLIERGQPTRHYGEAMRLNRMARLIGRELTAFRSVAVGDSLGEIADSLPIGPIAAIEGGAITAGLFEDAGGQSAVLLVNRDYRSEATVTLRLRDGVLPPQHLDVLAGVWVDRSVGAVRLEPGGAQLIRWARPTPRPR